MSCSVCLDEFTPVLKKPICCPFCDLKTCLMCMKNLALLWAANPKCAGCEKNFSTDNIDAMFTKSFRRGQLRIQVIQNLVEQEMSLLPETMEHIQVLAAQAEYRSCVNDLKMLHYEFEQDILQDIGSHVEKLVSIQNRVRPLGQQLTVTKKTEKSTKTVKCPNNAGTPDECRGYIISNGCCALCKTKLCKDCNVAIQDDHVCKPDDVLSWTSIKDLTVGCPKCGTRIQKISGCNQMWCTVKDCNTAFDWATGKIVNGPVHNPHYHQWLANGGGGGVAANNADIACQGPRGVVTNVRIRSFYQMMQNIVTLSRRLLKDPSLPIGPTTYFGGQLIDSNQPDSQLSKAFAIATHYIRNIAEAVDVPHHANDYGPMYHRDLRIDFLQNKITKAQWASKISHRETIRTKQAKCRELHVMFQSACADIFAKLYTDTEKNCLLQSNTVALQAAAIEKNLQTLELFNHAAEDLRQYYNDQLKRILSDYSDKGARLLEFQKPGRFDTMTWHYVNI